MKSVATSCTPNNVTENLVAHNICAIPTTIATLFLSPSLCLSVYRSRNSNNYLNISLLLCFVSIFAGSGVTGQQLKGNQEDPCKVKGRVVGDEVYCDRYWECVSNQPELYDCPNGLVFAGKHRGVTEGCDYPWRANYCEGKQLASEYSVYAGRGGVN